jgi:hypothetical protein
MSDQMTAPPDFEAMAVGYLCHQSGEYDVAARELQDLLRFAYAAGAAAEREECLADAVRVNNERRESWQARPNTLNGKTAMHEMNGAFKVEMAIRARANKGADK